MCRDGASSGKWPRWVQQAWVENQDLDQIELDWVRPAGRKDVPGKPIQYATTENFLNHFNIQKLSDLPTIDELGSAGLIDTSAIDKSIFGTGKFFKEQSIDENKNDIYDDIDDAIKKAPEDEK